MLLITEEAVVAFIKRNAYDLDFRKVGQLWFLDLVTARLHDPRLPPGHPTTGQQANEDKREAA